MNSALEHTTYRKFHQRLPHFTYRVLATDRVTQLYATWQFARDCMYRIASRTPNHRTLELCKRVSELHKRHFLRAFAKAHPLPKLPGSYWQFGSATDTRSSVNSRDFTKAFKYQYTQNRFWRQHIPNLP